MADRMKRRHFAAVVGAILLCAGADCASAQIRLDFEIALPIFEGINTRDLGVPGGATISRYLFLLPMVDAAYQFGEGPVRFGVGARAVTYIVETLLWPDSFVEIDLRHIVIRGDLGGGLFLSFGGVNQVPDKSWTWIVPQIDVSFAHTDWFRLSGGAIALVPFDNMDTFGFLLYMSARFIILFK
jgi:hypothetical protein